MIRKRDYRAIRTNLELLLDELRRTGRRANGLELDLSDPQAPSTLFDHVEATCGTVTILVNNATYSMRDGIENLSAEQMDKHYAVNVRAMALLCAEFVRRCKGEHFGRSLRPNNQSFVGTGVKSHARRTGLRGHKRSSRSLQPEFERRSRHTQNYSECG